MHSLAGYTRSLFYLMCILSMQTVLGNFVVIEGPWKTFKQPDGTVIEFRQNGDSGDSWFEDRNGYVLKLHENALFYQLREGDDLILAHAETPPNAMISSEKWASFSPNETKLPIKQEEIAGSGRSISSRFQVTSVSPSQPLLIVALTFNNSSMKYTKDQHLKKFYGSGSLSEYFDKASFRSFNITPARETQGVHNDGYIQVKLNMDQPDRIGSRVGTDAAGNQISNTLVRSIRNEIFKEADKYIDFSVYDTNQDQEISANELAITIIVSGWEAAYNQDKKLSTWGHWAMGGNSDTFDNVRLFETSAFGEKSSDNELFYIALLAHELGHHMLRLPDLYTSTEGESYTFWGVMGASFCCDYNEPLDFSGWSKDQVGFIKPKLHNQTQSIVSLRPSHKYPDAYKIWIDPYRHNEYLMLEFKTKDGINTALKDSGLVVTQVAEYHTEFNNLKFETTKSVIPLLDNGRPYGHSRNGLTNVRDKAGVMTDISITDIKINGTTSVSAKVNASIKDKSSIGYNEAPHLRLTYSSKIYSTQPAIIMEIENTALYADGIDLPKRDTSNFGVDVRLATSLENIQKGNYFYSQNCTLTKLNWNRCMFPNPVAIQSISPLYVYILYKGGSYVFDPGPISNKFYTYSPGSRNSPQKWSDQDVSMRLLVSGLAPNSPPTFSKTSVDVPVATAFTFDKNTINSTDPDGDDANVSVTYLSANEPGVDILKAQYGYTITAPASALGKTVKAEMQLADALDVTQGTIELRFVDANKSPSATGGAPAALAEEKKKDGGGSLQTPWTVLLLLLLLSTYLNKRNRFMPIKLK